MDLSNHLGFLVNAVISLKGSRTKSLDSDVNFHKMQGTEEHFEQQCKWEICPVQAQASCTHHIPASSRLPRPEGYWGRVYKWDREFKNVSGVCLFSTEPRSSCLLHKPSTSKLQLSKTYLALGFGF